MIYDQLVFYPHKISVFHLVIYLRQLVWVEEYYYFHHNLVEVEGSKYRNTLIEQRR